MRVNFEDSGIVVCSSACLHTAGPCCSVEVLITKINHGWMFAQQAGTQRNLAGRRGKTRLNQYILPFFPNCYHFEISIMHQKYKFDYQKMDPRVKAISSINSIVDRSNQLCATHCISRPKKVLRGCYISYCRVETI